MDLRERLSRIKENITATIPQRTISRFLNSVHPKEPAKLLSKIEIETRIRMLPYEAVNLAIRNPSYEKDYPMPFSDEDGNTWLIKANRIQRIEINVTNENGELSVISTYVDTLKKDQALLRDPSGKALVEFVSIGGIITIVKPSVAATQ